MIKAIIFDFDGVIVDSETEKFMELQSILINFNKKLKKSDFKDMIGKKTEEFLYEKFPTMKDPEIKKIVMLRREIEFSKTNKKLIPGIKKIIKFIKKNRIKIVITSGSNRKIIEKTIKSNSIEKFFDAIIAGEDFKKSKPSPECYRVTLKKFNLKTSEVIIIEDSIAGIKAAKSAGCKVFGIMTYFNRNQLHEANKVFLDHIAILEYLKEKNILKIN